MQLFIFGLVLCVWTGMFFGAAHFANVFVRLLIAVIIGAVIMIGTSWLDKKLFGKNYEEF
jgi:hypothetical protein